MSPPVLPEPQSDFTRRVRARVAEIVQSPEFQAELQRGRLPDRTAIFRGAAEELMQEDAQAQGEQPHNPTWGDVFTAPVRAGAAGAVRGITAPTALVDKVFGTQLRPATNRLADNIRGQQFTNSPVANYANDLTESMGEFVGMGPIFRGLSKAAGAIPGVNRAGEAMAAASKLSNPVARGTLEALPREMLAGVAGTGVIAPDQFFDPATQGQNLGFGVLGALLSGAARAPSLAPYTGQTDNMAGLFGRKPTLPDVQNAETSSLEAFRRGTAGPGIPDIERTPELGDLTSRLATPENPTPGAPIIPAQRPGTAGDLGIMTSADEFARQIFENAVKPAGLTDPRVRGSAGLPNDPGGAGITGQEADALAQILPLARGNRMPIGDVGTSRRGGSPNVEIDPNIVQLPDPEPVTPPRPASAASGPRAVSPTPEVAKPKGKSAPAKASFRAAVQPETVAAEPATQAPKTIKLSTDTGGAGFMQALAQTPGVEIVQSGMHRNVILTDANGEMVGIAKLTDFDGQTRVTELQAVQRGGGRRVMQELTRAADQTGRDLALDAVPLDPVEVMSPQGKLVPSQGVKLTPKQLWSFYEEFGFFPRGPTGRAMVRPPAEGVAAPEVPTAKPKVTPKAKGKPSFKSVVQPEAASPASYAVTPADAQSIPDQELRQRISNLETAAQQGVWADNLEVLKAEDRRRRASPPKPAATRLVNKEGKLVPETPAAPEAPAPKLPSPDDPVPSAAQYRLLMEQGKVEVDSKGRPRWNLLHNAKDQSYRVVPNREFMAEERAASATEVPGAKPTEPFRGEPKRPKPRVRTVKRDDPDAPQPGNWMDGE